MLRTRWPSFRQHTQLQLRSDPAPSDCFGWVHGSVVSLFGSILHFTSLHFSSPVVLYPVLVNEGVVRLNCAFSTNPEYSTQTVLWDI